jgi:hypothetical protein
MPTQRIRDTVLAGSKYSPKPRQTTAVVVPWIEPRLVKTVPEIGVIPNKLTLFTRERKVMFSLSNMK